MNRSSKKNFNQSNRSKRKPRKHQCALCHQILEGSYSDHYCQTDIRIEASPVIKKYLRKDSMSRSNFPDVQHVWADAHPTEEGIFLLKIKAPLDIIPDFIEDVKKALVEHESRKQARASPVHEDKHRSTPSPSNNNFHAKSHRRPANELICSFYNSPDGCTNVNCQRIHREDPVEKARLLKLKRIIEESKVLNDPIKSHYELLNECQEEHQYLNESIQRNFDSSLRKPTDNPEFAENLHYIREAYRFGLEFEELRDNLKFLARKSYTNSNPEIINQLEEQIAYSKTRVHDMQTYGFSRDKIYDRTKDIYDQQFLSQCTLVC